MITSLGEEEAGLCASRAFVCFYFACISLCPFFSSCCQGLTAASDCGTSWTFLLTVLFDMQCCLNFISWLSKSLLF